MMNVVNVGQRVDGDLPISNSGGHKFQTVTGTYVGGQPCGIGPSGLVFGTDLAAVASKFLGTFYNDSLTDTKNGGGEVLTSTDLTLSNPSVCYPGNKIKVWQGAEQADATPPYENVTWAVGNDVFISSGGLWTNVSGSGLTTSWGKVIVPPATYGGELIFEFQKYDAVPV